MALSKFALPSARATFRNRLLRRSRRKPLSFLLFRALQTSGYEFPWPHKAELADPLDSNDPRIEEPKYRKKMEEHRDRQNKLDAELQAEIAAEDTRARDHRHLLGGQANLAEADRLKNIEAERLLPVDHTVTPEIRASIREFAVTWHELCSLEDVVMRFSAASPSLEALKPYEVSPQSPFPFFCLSRLLTVSAEYDFSTVKPSALKADVASRVQLLEDSLLYWYRNRTSEVFVPDDHFNRVLGNIAMSTQISVRARHFLPDFLLTPSAGRLDDGLFHRAWQPRRGG